MNLFVYGDESGVFDKVHNDVFVFGGLVFLSKEEKENASRKFLHAERCLASSYGKSIPDGELKAARLKPKHKANLFRSLNKYVRYAFVVNQQSVMDEIFQNKKSKQRYLDYVYKVGLKRTLAKLMDAGSFEPGDIDNIYICFDEHTTATNGRYELREGIEEEFKSGTFNYRYNVFHKPLFPNMVGGISLDFVDSKNNALIRASDIIANQVLFHEANGRAHEMAGKVLVTRFP